jgi:hypothetical protein
MVAWLHLEATSLCRRGLRENPPLGRKATWRRSWLLGFVDGIDIAMREGKVAAEEQAPPRAVSALARRHDEALNFLRDHLAIHPCRNRVISVDPIGFAQGVAAGRNVHLGKSLKEPA